MDNFRRALSSFILLSLLALSAVQLRYRVGAQTGQPAQIKINPQTFDDYVGQYQDVSDPESIFSVFREGDKYYIQPTDVNKIEIFPASESKFFLKIVDVQVDFIRDASGTVTSIVHQGGRDYPAKKISNQPAQDTRIPFTRSEVMIPMRDGVRLYTVILTPQNQTEPLPIVFNRTPYGVRGRDSDRVNVANKELVADGYIFIFQDIRGKNDSEGQFEMVRPPRDKHDMKATDESTDTYDTIDWLVKNVPNNNGRVGIMGGSYDGWLSTMALIDPHPALKADSPQAPVADFWMGQYVIQRAQSAERHDQ